MQPTVSTATSRSITNPDELRHLGPLANIHALVRQLAQQSR